MNKSIYLGSCMIEDGKWTRNNFIYNPLYKSIHIDLDSDYSFSYQINMRNPRKAFDKAKKLVDKLINRFLTQEELIEAGFVFNGPEQYEIDKS